MSKEKLEKKKKKTSGLPVGTLDRSQIRRFKIKIIRNKKTSNTTSKSIKKKIKIKKNQLIAKEEEHTNKTKIRHGSD